MIKIDFLSPSSELVSNTIIKFESRNPYLQTYQSILSSFFLITTLINATTWGMYLYRIDRRELGHVQYWLLGGLAINFIFNLPVKQLYFVYNEAIIVLVSFVNAISISYVLMINLVLLHGISASFDLDWRWFYVPKIVLIVPVFAVMILDKYFSASSFKEKFENKMHLEEISVTKHTLNFTMFLVVMFMYFTVLFYYAYLSLSIPGCVNNEKVRFSSVAIAMTLFLTMATAIIVVMPFESQMLAFINEHGIINLSVIMINYLYAPSTEQYGDGYESDEEPS
jgi:hypothetical protein